MAEVKTDGFQGILYPVENRKDKVVITLSGSEGGMEHAEKMAKFHQSQKMPALALAYFGTEQTGKWLSGIPLSYIGNAIRWLKEKGYEKIALEGISKGAEYAAAAAIKYPEISCVILKAPSYFYSEGLVQKAPSDTCCWTDGEEELPFTPYKLRSFNMKKQLLRERELNLLPLNTGKDVREESLIPIEKIGGPVLLLSTEADRVWPSAESGRILEERLEKKSFPYAHRHIVFQHMSHLMFENANKKVRLLFKSERHFPKECARERSLMGQEVCRWLEEVWE